MTDFNIAAWFYCIPKFLGLIAAEPLTLCVAAAAAVSAAFFIAFYVFLIGGDVL